MDGEGGSLLGGGRGRSGAAIGARRYGDSCCQTVLRQGALALSNWLVYLLSQGSLTLYAKKLSLVLVLRRQMLQTSAYPSVSALMADLFSPVSRTGDARSTLSPNAVWMSGDSMPIAHNKARYLAIGLHLFFAGLAFSTETLFPPVFSVLLLRDMFAFWGRKDLDFGVSAWDVFWGTATDDSVLTSRFYDKDGRFTDHFVGDVNLYKGLWVSALVMAGLLGASCLFRRFKQKHDLAWSSQSYPASKLSKSATTRLDELKASCGEGNALSRLYALQQVKRYAFSVQDRRHLGHGVHLSSFDGVRGDGAMPGGVGAQGGGTDMVDLQMTAISTTGGRAAAGPSAAAPLLATAGAPTAHAAGGIALLQHLAKILGDQTGPVGWAGKYMAWCVDPTAQGWHTFVPCFLFASTRFGVYAFFQYRLYQMLYSLLEKQVEFDAAKSACDAKGMQWNYVEQAGNFVCNLCSDWQPNYLGHLADAQGCLDIMLTQPQGVAAISASFHALGKLRGADAQYHLNSLDLTQQPWWCWTNATWHTMRDTLVSRGSHLSTLNMSFAFRKQVNIDPTSVDGFSVFLKDVWIDRLDLHNAVFPPAAQSTVLQHIGMNTFSTMDLSGLSLSASGYTHLYTALQSQSALRSLQLNDMALGGQGCSGLMPAIRRLPLTTLSLSNAALGQSDLDCLGGQIPSTLSSLVLSSNDLNSLSMQNITQSLASRRVTLLDVSDAGLSSANLNFMSALPHVTNCILSGNTLRSYSLGTFVQGALWQSVQSLDMSRGQIDDEGLAYIASNWYRASRLQALNIAQNVYSDAGFRYLTRYLPNATYTTLDISSTPLPANELIDFFPAVWRSSVQDLSLYNTQMTDRDLTVMTQLSGTHTMTLTSLHLGQNVLHDTSVAPFLTSLNGNGVLEQINLSKNPVTSAILGDLSPVVTSTALQKINLDYCSLSDESFSAFIHQAAHSNIRSISAIGNRLGDLTAEAVAAQLVTGQYLEFEGDHSFIDPANSLTADEYYQLALATPAWMLGELHVDINEISGNGANSMCRVLPMSSLNLTALGMTKNPMGQFDMASCSDVVNHTLSSELSHASRRLEARSPLMPTDIDQPSFASTTDWSGVQWLGVAAGMTLVVLLINQMWQSFQSAGSRKNERPRAHSCGRLFSGKKRFDSANDANQFGDSIDNDRRTRHA